MINEFKVGYYYKWIGNENNYYWDDETKIILDNKWHKCIGIVKTDKGHAQFEGMKHNWSWDKRHFIETKYPPKIKVKKLLKEI